MGCCSSCETGPLRFIPAPALPSTGRVYSARRGRGSLQNVLRDHSADLGDVRAALELKLGGKGVREHQEQLRIREQLRKAGGLDGEILDLGIGHDAVASPLSGDPLNVDGNDPLIRKNELISNGLERHLHRLAIDEERRHFLFDRVDFDLLQIPYRVLIEIHSHNRFLLCRCPFDPREVIPTRQVETQSKLFCIDRLIPFGFI